jgi:hypothetical protein
MKKVLDPEEICRGGALIPLSHLCIIIVQGRDITIPLDTAPTIRWNGREEIGKTLTSHDDC